MCESSGCFAHYFARGKSTARKNWPLYWIGLRKLLAQFLYFVLEARTFEGVVEIGQVYNNVFIFNDGCPVCKAKNCIPIQTPTAQSILRAQRPPEQFISMPSAIRSAPDSPLVSSQGPLQAPAS
jgi:hypothetical protein